MSLLYFARQNSWRDPLERWLPRLQRRQVSSATALAYLVLIALAELITTFSDPRVGLTLHGMLLVVLLLHTALVSKHAYHRLLLSLTLAPLIRILSLTLPLVGFPLLYWYFIISVPLLVAAALMAFAGIYTVTSYAVSQRTQEIGIRMALGASVGDVLRMVINQGLRLIVVGLGVGIIGAFVLSRLLASIPNMLYDVSPTDPVTLVGVSLLLVGAAFLACYIPARRATKIDPIEALRYE